MDTLNEQQAFLAMYEFLRGRFDRIKSEDLGALLGELSSMPDGGTADPAVRQEWRRAIEAVKQGSVNPGLILKRP